MNLPQIGISYIDSVPQSIIDEFLGVVSHPTLDVRSETRSREEAAYACTEWLLPTAVVLFISKAYFDGFLKEMGKDHYYLLKKGLIKLKVKLNGYVAVRLTATPGKVSKEPAYSLTLSVYAEADDAQRFKLLIQNNVSDTEYEEIIDAFLSFLSAYNNRALPKSMLNKLSTAKVAWKTLLLAYNFDTHELDPINVPPDRTNK
jgi:hypothetical protein